VALWMSILVSLAFGGEVEVRGTEHVLSVELEYPGVRTSVRSPNAVRLRYPDGFLLSGLERPLVISSLRPEDAIRVRYPDGFYAASLTRPGLSTSTRPSEAIRIRFPDGSYTTGLQKPSVEASIRPSDAIYVRRPDGLLRTTLPDPFGHPVVLLSPNGGERWPAGGRRTIRWMTTYADTVVLFYSSDGGATWKKIAETMGSSYIWNLPNAVSDRALVKVAIKGSAVEDVSDGTFSIVELPIYSMALSSLHPDPNPEVSVGMSGGKVYRYYRAVGPGGTPVDASEVGMVLYSGGTKFVPDVRLAGGVLEICLDVDKLGIPEGGSRKFFFPSMVSLDGWEVPLTSAPLPFTVKRVPRRYTRRWDVFAGGSAGVTGTVGSIGAGATVAAARLSVKGEGGMGITVAKEHPEGTFVLSRRLESGVAAGLQVPGVGVPVGEVKVGVGAEVAAKGLVSQTLRFDLTSPEEARIGQAGFLLETFSLGGLALSPGAGLVLNAIVHSLNTFSGAQDALQKALYEESFGVGIEGSVGTGFGMEAEPVDLKFVEGSESVALLLEHVRNLRDGTERCSYEATLGVSLDALKSAAFQSGLGVEVSTSVGQAMTFSPEGRPVLYSVWVSSSDVGRLSMYREVRTVTTAVEVSGDVLRRLTSDPGVGNLYSLAVGNPLLVGASALASDIAGVLEKAEAASERLGAKAFDYKVTEEKGKLLEFSLEVSLEAALGVGVGTSLGVEGRLFDATEMSAEGGVGIGKSEYALCRYSWDGYIDESEDFVQVCGALFSDVVDLIEDALKKLCEVAQEVVQEGVETVVEAVTGTGEAVGELVADVGSLAEGYILELARYEPFTPRVIREASGRYTAKRAYISDRVYHRIPGPRGKLVAKPAGSVLIVISDAFVVSVRDPEGRPVTEFGEPLTLALKVEDEHLERFGFSPEDKGKVGVYFYDDATLSWTLVGGELDERGFIRVPITRAGTYALGIERRVEDTLPPEIEDITPREGSTVLPRPTFRAKVRDEGGSGLDLASAKMYLDGDEVMALYDFSTGELSYTPEKALAPGVHTLRLEVEDNAGNRSQAEVSFTVRGISGDFDEDGKVDFDDFFLLVAHFGTKAGEPDFDPKYDMDGDGRVDFEDFFSFVGNFGRTAKLASGPGLSVTTRDEGSHLTLEVKAPGAGGFGVLLEYDPEAYELSEAEDSVLVRSDEGRLALVSTSQEARLLFREEGGLGGFVKMVAGVVADPSGRLRMIEGRVLKASKFRLGLNEPNPFNPCTAIGYALPEEVHVKIAVYDALGRLVRILVDRRQPAGRYRVVWDGRDERGVPASSGVYVVRMEAEKFQASRKVVLIR